MQIWVGAYVIYEFCADGTINLTRALRAGANRVELCSNLVCGGLTPDPASIAQAKELCVDAGVPLMCMIRPRPGNFFYQPAEIETMYNQACMALDLGVSGVVLGLTKFDAELQDTTYGAGSEEGLTFDAEQMYALLRAIRNYSAQKGYGDTYPSLEITYHMAFDELPPDNQLKLLRLASDFGITRVLTHGGPLTTPISETLGHLQALIDHIKQEHLDIKILPGGGITWENAHDIARELGVDELHGTRIIRF